MTMGETYFLMVMSTQLERVSAHFEHVKDHSLDIRRYYRTVEY